MQTVHHVDSQASQPNGNSSGVFPGTRLHMAWRPLPAGYRVMAQLPDCSAILLSFAPSRQEAVHKAETWADEYEAEPSGESSDGKAERIRAVSIYVERWVGSLQTGCWEVLCRSAGGFYRQLRSVQSGGSAARGSGTTFLDDGAPNPSGRCGKATAPEPCRRTRGVRPTWQRVRTWGLL